MMAEKGILVGSLRLFRSREGNSDQKADGKV